MHYPEHFTGICPWDLGRNQCFWLISSHYARLQQPLQFTASSAGTVRPRASPAEPLNITTQDSTVIVRIPTDHLHHHPILGNSLLLRSGVPSRSLVVASDQGMP